MSRECSLLVPVEDDASPTGVSCSTCGRATAVYAGKQQHRRGGDMRFVEPRPRPLSRAEVVGMLPERIEAVEDRLTALLEAQRGTEREIVALAVEVREWTARQPIYVEMRPRHERIADGGQGGNRERKGLRRLGPGAA